MVWRKAPASRSEPVVVVQEDRPGAEVLWACERARASRVLPGQRYAQALGLCSGLRAYVISESELVATMAEVVSALGKVAPHVEPALTRGREALGRAGTFWLDGAGLERLYATKERWAQEVGAAVERLGFSAAVVVGFSRFSTYAIARAMAVSRPSAVVFASDEKERMAARRVPLDRLELSPRLRDALARLGVHTLGQLVMLPDGGMLERFGPQAFELVQLAKGERWDPLVPVAPREAAKQHVLLDDEERALEPLLFIIKGALDRLLAELAGRRRALTALHIELRLRRTLHDLVTRADCIKPAEPTLDARSLLRLVHLRLEGAPPEAGVVEILLWADDTLATREQLSLFTDEPPRDLRAANEAIARVRAELGEDAVVTAVLCDGHLPEASFSWKPLHSIEEARAREPRVCPLVRRIFAQRVALPPQVSNVRDDGWMLSSLEHGSVTRVFGPFVISGGWWAKELHREYHFADTKRGDCLWMYYDLGRRRWFWQGLVE